MLVPPFYKKLAYTLTVVCLCSLSSLSAEKGLSQTATAKIKNIADFMSSELKAREILTIKYEGITDTEGRRSAMTKLLSEELKKQLKANNIVISDEGTVIVKGVLIKFKYKKDMYRLRVDAIGSDGKVITSYTGVMK